MRSIMRLFLFVSNQESRNTGTSERILSQAVTVFEHTRGKIPHTPQVESGQAGHFREFPPKPGHDNPGM